MSKIDEKKKAIANKMNSKTYGKEKANGRKAMRPIIEGDMDGTDVYENKFSKKDVSKEVKARKLKAKSDWDN